MDGMRWDPEPLTIISDKARQGCVCDEGQEQGRMMGMRGSVYGACERDKRDKMCVCMYRVQRLTDNAGVIVVSRIMGLGCV